MRMVFHKRFKNGLDRLPSALKDKTVSAIRRFATDPFHPSPRNHSLKGRLAGCRAFFVTQSVRVIFEEQDGYAVVFMLDIGTHDRVYR